MRLSWRRSSRVEDRLDKWIAQQHQDQVFAGKTVPVGPHPDEAFLRNLARKSKQISLSDSRLDHVAHCPACLPQFLTFRRENESRRRKLMLVSAAASCLVIIAAIVSLARYRASTQSPAASVALVSETVNLWDAGTLRGEQPGSLQSVFLPAALVRVKIILPRFSTPGKYAVAVTMDQGGNGVVAQSSVTATTNGQQEMVFVDLDLRRAKAGAYFLSTTHEQDQASYYYPLQIR
jgi:hypothetical protein